MTRRFVRKTHPTIKELVEEEQCGCGNRMLPYLMKTATEPCTTPYLTGEVLHDSGFETQLSTFGTGPNLADDIPHFLGGQTTDFLFKWPESSDNFYTNDPDLGDETYWAQDWNTKVTGIDRWLIKTASPRSGTRHARLVTGINTYYGTNAQLLYPIRQVSCSKNGDTWDSTSYQAYSAKVNPGAGNVITLGVWAKVDTLTDNPQLDLHFAGHVLGVSDGTTYQRSRFTLTTTYTYYEASIVMQGSDDVVLCYFGPLLDTSDFTVTFDLDDASLVVT